MSEINSRVENLMEAAGVRPTSNRILVLRELMQSDTPMSLVEIEERLRTVDRSSILRVLSLLHQHRVIHTMEDGRGVTKYEVCHGHDGCSIDDMHPHFYCECCGRVYCLDDVDIPRVSVPNGYTVNSVNYMLKGICSDCAHSKQ